jgi:small subunit ribosomal protein S6
MAKNKLGKTPHYELLYIIPNKYSEDELKPIVEKVNKLITDNEGKVTYEEVWGKKKMCYPIQGFNHGYYQLAEFYASEEYVNKINHELRIDRDVLRHMIVVKAVVSEEEREAKKKKAEKKMIEKVEEKKKEEEKPKEEPKKKVNMKELDEKLDKILDTDDLL